MSENIEFGSDADVRAAIERGEIIGGALDARSGQIVPVKFARVYRNDYEGYTLGEYTNVNNEVLAMLAEVDKGGRTRCWRLTDAAQESGYAETEVIYSGRGMLHHWDGDDSHSVYVAPADTPNAQEHVSVAPGESFTIVAQDGDVRAPSAGQIGVRVLSFCTVPFQLAYEEIIDTPTKE